MTETPLRLVDKDDMDKAKALEAALSQIERSFGKGSIMKLGDSGMVVDAEAISTGSIGLDIALGIGGMPRGRVAEIYGPESSGKTTLALSITAEAQKLGGTCAFVDAEHALDPGYARKLGLDVERRGTGRDAVDAVGVFGAQAHDRALSVLLLDLVQGEIERLGPVRGFVSDHRCFGRTVT